MVLGVKAQTAASGVRVQGFDCMGGQAHLPGALSHAIQPGGRLVFGLQFLPGGLFVFWRESFFVERFLLVLQTAGDMLQYLLF
jgi:hypothetical protein